MWIFGLFVSAIFFIWIQAKVFRRWGLRKVSYTRYFNVSEVYEGDEIQMIEIITNNKLLPIPWIRVESKINKELVFGKEETRMILHDSYHRSMFSLLPYMKILRRYNLTATKRGCYNLSSVLITCGNFFSIGKVSYKEYDLNAKLIVYPRLVPIEDIPLPSHSFRGDVVIKRFIIEDPFMISGVREYQYGDALNQINWKASARSGSLQVHKLDFTSDTRLMILLNIDVWEEESFKQSRLEDVETGISYAASIANHYISMGVETGFGSNGTLIHDEKEMVYVEANSNKEHLHILHELMARLIIKRRVTFYTFLEEEIQKYRTNRDYLIITPYMDEEILGQIDRLKNQGNAVEYILLGKDEDMDD